MCLESLNLDRMKMFIIGVEEVVMSSSSLNTSKIGLFSYRLGKDSLYDEVSAEVPLDGGSPGCWVINETNVTPREDF